MAKKKPGRRPRVELPIRVHPIALQWPRIIGKPREDMKADIETNGVQVPIVEWNEPGEGRCLIDGLNRAELAVELGQRYEDLPRVESKVKTTLEALRLVHSLNGPRRHLTSGQRAQIAIDEGLMARRLKRAAGETEPEPAPRRAGGQTNANGVGAIVEEALPPGQRFAGDKAAAAAQAVETNKTSLTQAARLRELAPDLADQVHDGHMSLNRAWTILKERQAPGEDGESDEVVDGLDQPVPRRFRAVFLSRIKVTEALTALSRAVRPALRSLADDAPSYVDRQTDELIYQQLVNNLRHAVPYAVCCYCDGEGKALKDGAQRRTECEPCRGQGWLNKDLYDRADASLKNGDPVRGRRQSDADETPPKRKTKKKTKAK